MPPGHPEARNEDFHKQRDAPDTSVVKRTPSNQVSDLPSKQRLAERSANNAIFLKDRHRNSGDRGVRTTTIKQDAAKNGQLTMKTSALKNQMITRASRSGAILTLI